MNDKQRQNAKRALQTVREIDVQAERDINTYIDLLENELGTVRSDRNRLIENLKNLTGLDVLDILPSGIAMDEELEKWLRENYVPKK
jgi:hypothetical protein